MVPETQQEAVTRQSPVKNMTLDWLPSEKKRIRGLLADPNTASKAFEQEAKQAEEKLEERIIALEREVKELKDERGVAQAEMEDLKAGIKGRRWRLEGELELWRRGRRGLRGGEGDGMG